MTIESIDYNVYLNKYDSLKLAFEINDVSEPIFIKLNNLFLSEEKDIFDSIKVFIEKNSKTSNQVNNSMSLNLFIDIIIKNLKTLFFVKKDNLESNIELVNLFLNNNLDFSNYSIILNILSNKLSLKLEDKEDISILQKIILLQNTFSSFIYFELKNNFAQLDSFIREITTSVAQVKQTSDLVADNARLVAEAASQSIKISDSGKKAVSDSIEGVNKTKSQIETIADKILELSENTQSISKIVSTVEDISRQSKLLAFNASIEAAKAGEFGKGFSVVANEIKNLSEESKEATNRITDILTDIQNATNSAVMFTEEGTKLADSGVLLAQISENTINKLSESIQNSAEAAIQISASAEQQKIGMEQLEESMQNLKYSNL